jgi:hypothetical protein
MCALGCSDPTRGALGCTGDAARRCRPNWGPLSGAEGCEALRTVTERVFIRVQATCPVSFNTVAYRNAYAALLGIPKELVVVRIKCIKVPGRRLQSSEEADLDLTTTSSSLTPTQADSVCCELARVPPVGFVRRLNAARACVCRLQLVDSSGATPATVSSALTVSFVVSSSSLTTSSPGAWLLSPSAVIGACPANRRCGVAVVEQAVHRRVRRVRPRALLNV